MNWIELNELHTAELKQGMKCLKDDESLIVLVETKDGRRFKLERKISVSWTEGKVILFELS